MFENRESCFATGQFMDILDDIEEIQCQFFNIVSLFQSFIIGY